MGRAKFLVGFIGLILPLAVVGVYGMTRAPVKGRVVEQWSNRPVAAATIKVGERTAEIRPDGSFRVIAASGRKNVSVVSASHFSFEKITAVGFLFGKDVGRIVLTPRPTEEGARAFAQKQWLLLDAGRFGDAYRFLSPGTRRALPRADYVRSRRAEVKEDDVFVPTQIAEVTIEGDRARVHLMRRQPTAGVVFSGEATLKFVKGKWYQELD